MKSAITNLISNFMFVSVKDRVFSTDELIARIPANISSKKALLMSLSQQLYFPDYFGFNWDAFEECLCDLWWLKIRDITVLHSDIPLRLGKKDLRIYLEILSICVDHWSKKCSHSFTVVFPIESRAALEDFFRQEH